MAKRFISAATRARRLRQKDRVIHEVKTPGARKSRIDAIVDHQRSSPSPVRDQRREKNTINTSARRRIFNKNEITRKVKQLIGGGAGQSSTVTSTGTNPDQLAANVPQVNRPFSKVDKRKFKSHNVARQPVTADFPPRFSLGPLDVKCPFCGALSFAGETPSSFKCCENGKVDLPPLAPYPKALQELFTTKRTTKDGKDFAEHMRRYNSLFAMAATKMNLASSLPNRRGGIVRICGQVYHTSGSLHPRDGRDPILNQLYMFDSTDALKQRQASKLYDVNFSNNIMTAIQAVMDVNPFAASYKNMREVELEENAQALREGRQPREVKMYFHETNPLARTRNKPTRDDVAAIFTSDDGAPPKREYVVMSKTNSLTILNDLSPIVDPMSYPLLFPNGEHGYSTLLNHVGPNATAVRNRLTIREFYNHRLAIRDEIFNPIFLAGSLFQQYIVDAYCKIESNRLYFIRSNPQQLRVDKYSALADYVDRRQREADPEKSHAAGTPVLLPSSFEGSPRSQQMRYKDAMTVVSKHGKPDLFVTITCNPEWPEIKNNLKPGQTAVNAPHLTARVFKMYKDAIMREIWEDAALGMCATKISVIEFQKRGLPHCHLLIHFKQQDKLRTGADIDRLICAELPSKQQLPLLWSTVTKSMIHGPCGDRNPRCVCMVDKDGTSTCKQRYPKEWCPETTILPNASYPVYRRRSVPETAFEKRGFRNQSHAIDNRDVVPYNPYLSQKYNCHINVESCHHIRSVKYLYKYVYKSFDQGAIRFEQSTGDVRYDEITGFLEGRYIAAPEACWRIFAFPLHDNSHSVTRLQLHLPDTQPVYFHDGEETAAIENIRNTTLTSFFDLNSRSIIAHSLRYCDMVDSFIFEKGEWRPRKKNLNKPIIARMYYASPRDVERYHLRLLLLECPGPKSFEHLRTVNGVVHATFKDACRALNLISDDTHATNTMREITIHAFPSQVRRTFAFLLLFSDVSDAKVLWDDFKDSMCQDFHRKRLSPASSENSALALIASVLRKHSHTLLDHGLPPVDTALMIAPESVEQVTARADIASLHKSLNVEQKLAATNILRNIVEYANGDHSKSRIFYLDGPGGTGKTYLYNYLLAVCKTPPPISFSCSAWAGIAATLLENGRTCHSTFKLPVPCDESAKCNISPNSDLGEAIRDTVFFVLDEVSMVNRYALHAIDAMLKDVCGSVVDFAGKVMLFGGDFRQPLPIVPRGAPDQIIAASVLSSPLWSKATRFTLTRNMRVRAGEGEFAEFLLQMGSDKLPRKADPPFQGSIQIPTQCITTTDLTEEIFPRGMPPDEMHNRVILTPVNSASLILNDQILDRMPGSRTQYFSHDQAVVDEAVDDGNDSYPIEFVNSLTPAGLPPHVLNLKRDSVVMLLKNLDVERGMVNGTRLVVRGMHEYILQVEILTGVHRGQRHFIPKMLFEPSDSNLPFQLRRFQFPLRLAYSMTINKSQGQEFEKVGVYLDRSVFGHGQLYVAFSRARALRDIKLFLIPDANQGRVADKWYTRNLVFPSVLTACNSLKTVTTFATVPVRNARSAQHDFDLSSHLTDSILSTHGSLPSSHGSLPSSSPTHGSLPSSSPIHFNIADAHLPLVVSVAGLHNLGNTCYCNSILQMLRTVPCLWEPVNSPIVTNFQTAFLRLMDSLQLSGQTVHPFDFLHSLSTVSPIGVYEQQDAAEVLEFILNRFGEDDFFSRDKFHVLIHQFTVCCSCQALSRTQTMFPMLPVTPEVSVRNSVINFWDTTPVTYDCAQCRSGADGEGEMYYEAINAPDVLFVQLKRFAYDPVNGVATKTSDHIAPSSSIHIGNTEYSLIAAISHSGTPQRGHYIAHILLNDTWYKCNDNFVQSYSFANIDGTEVYILLYKRN